MIIERHYNLYYVYENDQYCHNYFMFEYFHDFFLNHCEKIELKEKINPFDKRRNQRRNYYYYFI